MAFFTTTRNFPCLFVQALQTARKTTAIWLVTYVIGRAKNLGLLGQSLQTRLATFAVAIRLVIFAPYTLSRVFFLLMKVIRLEFYSLNKLVSLPSFPAVGNLPQVS